MSDETKPVVPRIAEAVGSAAAGTTNNRTGGSLSKLYELTMSAAIEQCAKEGINDPKVVHHRMKQAREFVKAKWREAEAEAAKAATKSE